MVFSLRTGSPARARKNSTRGSERGGTGEAVDILLIALLLETRIWYHDPTGLIADCDSFEMNIWQILTTACKFAYDFCRDRERYRLLWEILYNIFSILKKKKKKKSSGSLYNKCSRTESFSAFWPRVTWSESKNSTKQGEQELLKEIIMYGEPWKKKNRASALHCISSPCFTFLKKSLHVTAENCRTPRPKKKNKNTKKQKNKIPWSVP